MKIQTTKRYLDLKIIMILMLKIYQVKYALFAISRLIGAKNGKIVGRKLNTVQIDVEIERDKL